MNRSERTARVRTSPPIGINREFQETHKKVTEDVNQVLGPRYRYHCDVMDQAWLLDYSAFHATLTAPRSVYITRYIDTNRSITQFFLTWKMQNCVFTNRTSRLEKNIFGRIPSLRSCLGAERVAERKRLIR